MTDPAFPGPDTLCEACGYALKGLQPDGHCPECGLAIDDSSPRHRHGPQWHVHPSPRTACELVLALMLRPKLFFRQMRIDGSNVPARLFIVLVAGSIGLMGYLTAWGLYGYEPLWALVESLIACDSVIVLSYVEALGVVYFSRRRGWRVPMRLAERIVCYSSVGWVPAGMAMFIVIRIYANGTLDRGMSRLLGVWGPWQSLGLLVLIAAAAMLGFEVLVWMGVRQARYANRPVE